MKIPNILIFMSADQGPWAMNCAGTSELLNGTPSSSPQKQIPRQSIESAGNG